MGRPIADKLGFKPGMAVRVEGAPDGLDIGLPQTEGVADLLLFFVRDARAIAAGAADIDARYRDGARLWIAYPKRTGSIRTDISRDRGWGPLAERDLLAVSQVALDGTWSALRFRRRREIARLTRQWEQR